MRASAEGGYSSALEGELDKEEGVSGDEARRSFVADVPAEATETISAAQHTASIAKFRDAPIRSSIGPRLVIFFTPVDRRPVQLIAARDRSRSIFLLGPRLSTGGGKTPTWGKVPI